MNFVGLFAKLGGSVGQCARAYARTAADREELAQEIAAQVWRSYPRFDPAVAKFSTWLYRVALNVAISYGRRVRTRPETTEVPELVAAEPDPRIAELYAAIPTLAPLERALVLLYLEDRSHAEIADELGQTVFNVEVLLF